MAHKKPNLPMHVCPVCQRPFYWRKKWEKIWLEVKYCSDRCRNSRSKLRKPPSIDTSSKTTK